MQKVQKDNLVVLRFLNIVRKITHFGIFIFADICLRAILEFKDINAFNFMPRGM